MSGVVEHESVGEMSEQLRRLAVAIDGVEAAGRLVGRPLFLARICEAARDAVVLGRKPYLTPQEAALECGDSEAFVAERADEGIIGRYGGPGNPMYSREELYAAIRERRWCNGGKNDGLGDGKWHFVEQLKDGMLPAEIKTVLLTKSLQDGKVLMVNQPKDGWMKITGWHFFMPINNVLTDAKVT